MKILWMPESEQDLRSIYTYIAEESPKSASKVVLSLVTFTELQLGTFPESGRTGRVTNTYEILVPKLPYWIPYRVKNDVIEILRVYHTRRQWPDDLS